MNLFIQPQLRILENHLNPVQKNSTIPIDPKNLNARYSEPTNGNRTEPNKPVTSIKVPITQKSAPRKLKYKSYKNIDISNTSFELSVELHELSLKLLKFEVCEEGRIIGGPRITGVNLRSW